MWTGDIRMKWRCDHCSCDCDLSNRKVRPKKVFGASTGFEPMASALALQCSTNWAMKTHTLRAGQFVECMPAVHIILICLIPFVGTVNSTNWPAPNIWVFIAQLVEHCNANAELWVRIPLKPPKHFLGLLCDCLNRNHSCDDHIPISCIFTCFPSIPLTQCGKFQSSSKSF